MIRPQLICTLTLFACLGSLQAVCTGTCEELFFVQKEFLAFSDVQYERHADLNSGISFYYKGIFDFEDLRDSSRDYTVPITIGGPGFPEERDAILAVYQEALAHTHESKKFMQDF